MGIEKEKEAVKYSMIDASTWSERDQALVFKRAGYLTVMLIGYFMLSFSLGFPFMFPGGPGWSVFLLWSFSFISGKALEMNGLPGLLGMLVSGIVLKNLPGGPVDGLPSEWGNTLRSFGLSLILMRSGLELDVEDLKRKGSVCARLTVMPGVCEAFAVSLANALIFGMPFALALSGGFILAAVSPAVVVSGMFDLQSKGFGVAKGIPSLIVAAASFDDVVAISGYAMCIGLAIDGGEDPILGAMHGPINLAAGAIMGFLGGRFVGMSRLWDSDLKRSIVTIITGLTFMFGAAQLHYTGAGALAGLATGVFGSMSWQTGNMGWLSEGKLAHAHHEVESALATLWELFAQPVLFAIIGASVNFSEIDMSIIPFAILVVIVGMCVRVPAAFMATYGENMTFKERAFIALAWIPKATVQAALGSVPLTLVHEAMEGEPNYDEYEKYAKAILVTAVVSILITAPIGLMVISRLGPLWLEKQEAQVETIEIEIETDESFENTDTDASGTVSVEPTDGMIQLPKGYGGLSNSKIILPAGYAGSKSQSKISIPTGGVYRSNSKIQIPANYDGKSAATIRKNAAGNTVAVMEVPKVFAASEQESWVYNEARKQAAKSGEKDDFNYIENTVYTKRFFTQLINHLNSAYMAIETANEDATNPNYAKFEAALEELQIVNEGVQSTWKVIQESKGFAALDLFDTEEGNYANVPTDDIVLRLSETEDQTKPSDIGIQMLTVKGANNL